MGIHQMATSPGGVRKPGGDGDTSKGGISRALANSRTLKPFFSSTFSDFTEEREHLVRDLRVSRHRRGASPVRLGFPQRFRRN